MKLITKLTNAATAVVIVASVALSVGHTNAAAPGQIVAGNHNYTIANVTKGTGFANPQSADACDVLEYRLRLYNPGPSSLSNVKMEASINTMTPYTSANSTATVYTPDGQTKLVAFQAVVNISTAQTQSYQAGTTQLLDSAGNVIQTLPDGITMGAGGISLGNIGDSVTEYVKFRTQLKCPTPVTPAYSCDAFTITADKDRTVKIANFSTSATNGAVFKNAVVNWGDNSTELNAANIIGQSHQYGKDGTYLISATAHFTVNGQDVTAGGPKCQQQVTFSPNTPPKVTPPPTTPTPPANLVNTGPGSVAAIFAATTAFGAVAHRRFLSRRLSRQS
jgi:hypothetical protein